jgi:hypothetical protein
MEIAVHCLSVPFAGLQWWRYTSELRIDVKHDHADIERQLAEVHARFRRAKEGLRDLPAASVELPGLVARCREADGEHYVYVEDTAQRRLAGYIVFNRLIELDRRADSYLRSPHAKIAPGYQRRGITTTVYRWWLDAGNCLITGARQSVAANALWRSFVRSRESFYVDLRDRKLRDLGAEVDACVLHDLHTRIVLLGTGWRKEAFAQCTGISTHAQPERRPTIRHRLRGC